MKSLPDQTTSDVSNTLTPCHPERSLAESAANRQTQSKDPCCTRTLEGNAVNFRIVIRFHDEQGIEFFPGPSREAAKECSPRRKPWVAGERLIKSRRRERSGPCIPQ
jgi:hypothetical protein